MYVLVKLSKYLYSTIYSLHFTSLKFKALEISTVESKADADIFNEIREENHLELLPIYNQDLIQQKLGAFKDQLELFSGDVLKAGNDIHTYLLVYFTPMIRILYEILGLIDF
jgi:hypothetical protein